MSTETESFELRNTFKEVEKELDWPNGRGQYTRLLSKLKDLVRERSIIDGIDKYQYSDRLYTLRGFIDDLKTALNYDCPENDRIKERVWWRQENFQNPIEKMPDDPVIWREGLLDAAALYLKNPWLQDNAFDWILIDSLIYAELSAYTKFVAEGGATGQPNWGLLIHKGDPGKMFLFGIGKAILKYFFTIILPIGLMVYFYSNRYEKAFLWALSLYGLYLLQKLIRWPWRYKQQKVEREAIKKCKSVLEKMGLAYSYSKGPVISMSRLSNTLNEAASTGAVFDGALFSLLKSVEARYGDALVIS